MRRMVVLLALLMNFIFAVNMQDGIHFESPRCRRSANCDECGSSSADKFYYEVNGYQVIIRFRDLEYFSLWCNSLDIDAAIPVDSPDLPAMSRPVQVEEIRIQGCIVPSNGSYNKALKAINVTTTSRLFLSDLPTNPKLERHHLRDLKISELEITANDSTNPPCPKYDYLKDLKLRTLKLKNVIPEPEALMLLPVTLEYLNLDYAELPTAALVLNNGNEGAWLKRLHSLHSLDLVLTETLPKTPGFITLPNLFLLPKLTNLSLHFVPLDPISLTESLKNSWIENLVLVSCGLYTLPQNMFEGVNLTSLSLTSNNLTKIYNVFSSLQWLTELDLSENELSGTELVRMLTPLTHARLKILKANDNPLGSLCHDTHNNSEKSSGLPKTLRRLELRGTGATRICSDWIENDALMHIDLQNNSIGNITVCNAGDKYNDLKMKRKANEAEPVWLNLTKNRNLRTINITGAHVQQFHIESLSFSNDSSNRGRAKVKLKLDALACDCNAYWLREALRVSLLNLERDVKCVSEARASAETTLLGYDFNGILCPHNDICLPECSCWKRPRDNATVVRCAGVLPPEPQWPPSAPEWPLALHIAAGTLATVPRATLVELHAPNNNIKSLEQMVIDKTLLILDVRNNSIERISEAAAKKLRALTAIRANRSVYLAGNPFACACSDAPAFELLNEVVNDWNITQCVDHSNVSKKTESELCSVALIPALAGTMILVLLLLSMGLLLLNFKSRLRKFLFRYNMCIQCIITPKDKANDSDKTHDVFLSYANEDYERLIELRKGLEDRGYATIEHTRDWQPGEAITEQITRSVLCARRTLLLVSDNYAKSKWALEEFYAAHAHAMERQTARVLIVRYNLNEPEKLPLNLQLYLKYNTYLDWSDVNFWNKLCQVMPPPRFTIIS